MKYLIIFLIPSLLFANAMKRSRVGKCGPVKVYATTQECSWIEGYCIDIPSDYNCKYHEYDDEDKVVINQSKLAQFNKEKADKLNESAQRELKKSSRSQYLKGCLGGFSEDFPESGCLKELIKEVIEKDLNVSDL